MTLDGRNIWVGLSPQNDLPGNFGGSGKSWVCRPAILEAVPRQSPT
jgi:hypothetical protein